MAHIENIFICITVPLLISLFFIKGKQRSFTMFICIGMSILHGIGVCKQFLYDNVWGGCRINSDSDRTCV